MVDLQGELVLVVPHLHIHGSVANFPFTRHCLSVSYRFPQPRKIRGMVRGRVHIVLKFRVFQRNHEVVRRRPFRDSHPMKSRIGDNRPMQFGRDINRLPVKIFRK